MLSVNAFKFLFDIAKELWDKKNDINQQGKSEAESIADTCGYIADALEDKRDEFLNGKGFEAIHIPAHIRAMSRLLEGKLPNDQHSDYLNLLRSAAGVVQSIESMSATEFSKLERTERDSLLEPMNTAIGEFRALSKTLYL